MPKLHLKRTPAEEQERGRRRAYRAARKAAKRKRSLDWDESSGLGSSKKYHTGLSDDDEVYGPPPPPASSHKPDYDAIRAEVEEAYFREKMWSALEDDERLDGIDARFNDYAHIPDRWARDEHDAANPQYMDDDEYAEWVREGMWKKKHAREYEEQVKRDREKTAQRARERELKAETTRLERLALEHEERRRKERQRQRDDEYRRRYEQQWKALLDPKTPESRGPLKFGDIPWPLFPTQLRTKEKHPGFHVEHFTPEAITAFILPAAHVTVPHTETDSISRQNRDKLKETLLRFHPDKFEGRLMHRVSADDVESVREAVGQVARVLNTLLSRQS